MPDFSIALGARVTDAITQFGGVVTGRASYITGCNQYLVQPALTESREWRDGRWFDEHRLVVDNPTAPVLTLPAVKDPGADIPAPIK